MDKKKSLHYIVLTMLVLLVGFMHLYRLTEIPYGLNVDEAGAAYDAFCIANYGVDRFLNSWPVYFTNYGDGQNALYIYMVAALVKVFGLSKWIIRIPMVFAAFVTAFYGCRYISLKWPGTKRYMVLLALYAVLPVFTMMQRFGLESHLMLAGGMVSLYYTAKALHTGKWIDYLLAGIGFGVTLYSYALSYIVIPVCLVLLLVYAVYMGKISWRSAAAFILPLGVLALPLIGVQIINFFDLPQMQIGPFTLTKLPEYRTNELSVSLFFENIWGVIKNTLFYDDLAYNTLAKYGALYYVSIPFIVAGVCKGVCDAVISCRTKRFEASVPMLAWFAGEFVMGGFLTGNSVPNSTRMNGIYVCWLYFLVEGLLLVYDKCIKKAHTVEGEQNTKRVALWISVSFMVVVSCIYLGGFLSFSRYYFTDYNAEVYPLKWLFFEEYDEVAALLEEHKEEPWTERSTCYNWPYVYYLLAYRIDPYEAGDLRADYVCCGKDFINYYPEDIGLDYNYVVFKTDNSSAELLNSITDQVYETEHYYVFVSSLEGFSESVSQDVELSMDTRKYEEGCVVFAGWCADKATEGAFETLELLVEGQAYSERHQTVNRQERADVAAAKNSDKYRMSGFSFSLTLEEYTGASNITLLGVREDGSVVEIVKYQKE